MSSTPDPALPRPPLYRDPYSRVMARVAFQLIRLDARRNPAAYKDPGTGVLLYAEQLRRSYPHHLYFLLVSLSKALSSGYSATSWRDDLDTVGRDRMIHKRKFVRRGGK